MLSLQTHRVNTVAHGPGKLLKKTAGASPTSPVSPRRQAAPNRRLQLRAEGNVPMSWSLPPPNLGSTATPTAPGGPLPPLFSATAGACFGLYYAMSLREAKRAKVASWAAPLAGAIALPAAVVASESPLFCLAAVGLGVCGYQALAPLNRRLGGDARSDELCRLGTAVAAMLLAAAQAHS